MVKVLLLGSLLWLKTLSAAEYIYENEFPLSFAAALSYINEHPETKMRLEKWNISPALAWSIVFPELIRYNAIKDYFEVRALKTLYIQYGNEYADFSIGHFQMKPSFAEAIQKEWLRNGYQPCPVLDTSESIAARKAIIERLDTHDGQLLYLMMFANIMQKKLGKINDLTDKVKLYSTAYNSSFTFSETTLRTISSQKNFHLGTLQLPISQYYCYSDIALYYFEKYGTN